jgi:signal transduction histidine kinase
VNSTAIVAYAAERLVLLGTADETISHRISISILKAGCACQFVPAATLIKMHEALRRSASCVALLDDRLLCGASLEETLLRLTEFAPVALVAGPERYEEVSRWVARGDVEFIARAGNFAPLAAAIVVRRIRWAEQTGSAGGVPWKEFPPDLAAILRHEINNPLTGILGNAELLLAHCRDKLPMAALQRVETVVDLAVRLREATRRLSNAVEMEHQQARSA